MRSSTLLIIGTLAALVVAGCNVVPGQAAQDGAVTDDKARSRHVVIIHEADTCPFLRMIFPYGASSPVLTMQKASLDLA